MQKVPIYQSVVSRGVGFAENLQFSSKDFFIQKVTKLPLYLLANSSLALVGIIETLIRGIFSIPFKAAQLAVPRGFSHWTDDPFHNARLSGKATARAVSNLFHVRKQVVESALIVIPLQAPPVEQRRETEIPTPSSQPAEQHQCAQTPPPPKPAPHPRTAPMTTPTSQEPRVQSIFERSISFYRTHPWTAGAGTAAAALAAASLYWGPTRVFISAPMALLSSLFPQQWGHQAALAPTVAALPAPQPTSAAAAVQELNATVGSMLTPPLGSSETVISGPAFTATSTHEILSTITHRPETLAAQNLSTATTTPLLSYTVNSATKVFFACCSALVAIGAGVNKYIKVKATERAAATARAAEAKAATVAKAVAKAAAEAKIKKAKNVARRKARAAAEAKVAAAKARVAAAEAKVAAAEAKAAAVAKAAAAVRAAEIDGEEYAEARTQASPEVQQKEMIKRAVTNLFDTGNYLNNETVLAWGKHLEKSGSCVFVPDLMIPHLSAGRLGNPNKRNNKLTQMLNTACTRARTMNAENPPPIFIPIVLAPTTRLVGTDHIVILTVDVANKKMEYYDSKGDQIRYDVITKKFRADWNWHARTRTIKGSDVTITQLLKSVEKELPGYTYLCNSAQHQQDNHNCGAFVSRFMQKRCNEKFLKICRFADINIEKERAFMGFELLKSGDQPLVESLAKAKDAIEVHSLLAHLNLNEAQTLKDQETQGHKKNGLLKKDPVFNQVNRDIDRHGNGKNIVSINGERSVEEKRDGSSEIQFHADKIYQDLMQVTKDEQKTLKIMSLLHQGVFAKHLGMLHKYLNMGMSGFTIINNGPVLAAIEGPTSEYAITITHDDNTVQVTCSCLMALQNHGLGPLSRTAPYGIIELEANATIDVTKDNLDNTEVNLTCKTISLIEAPSS